MLQQLLMNMMRNMGNLQSLVFNEVYILYCRVVDTPGLADPDVPPEKIGSMLANVVLLCPGGVHAFLYIHNSTDYRFTDEQKSVKEQVVVRFP